MKVAIIGAGITGLYLAWKLAEKGEEVTVFEKKDIVGKQVCSGLISERILYFIPESKKLIQNQIDFCLIHFPKRTLKIHFSKKFFVMNHFELDNLTTSLAQRAGAKIIFNSYLSASDIDKFKGKVERIIGSDGAFSQVRKSLNIKNPEFYSGIQGFLKQNDFSNFIEAWPTAAGFIWKIPRGTEIEYGVMEKPKDAKLLFEEFLAKNNINLERISSALISQGLIVSQNSKIALCGEAAGLTKPWSGGGVIWGLMAADLLLKNFPDFLKYKKELKKFFLPNIIFSKITKKMVYFFGFNFSWLLPKNVKIEGDFLI